LPPTAALRATLARLRWHLAPLRTRRKFAKYLYQQCRPSSIEKTKVANVFFLNHTMFFRHTYPACGN